MTLRYSRPLLVLIGVIASSLFIVPGPLGLAPVDYVLGVVILLGLVGGTTHERQPPWSRSSFKLASGLWLATMVLASAFSDDRSAAFLQTGKNAAGLLYLCVSISAAVALPESVLLRWTAPVVGALCLAIVLDIYISYVGGRQSGFFPNPIHAATWAGVSMVVLAAAQRGRRAPRIAAMLPCAVVLFLAGSFAVYLGLVAVLVYLNFDRKRVVPFLYMLSVGVLGFSQLPNRWQVFQEAVDPESRGSASAASRLNIWEAAWKVAEGHPFGIGPGGIFSVLPSADARYGSRVRDA